MSRCEPLGRCLSEIRVHTHLSPQTWSERPHPNRPATWSTAHALHLVFLICTMKR